MEESARREFGEFVAARSGDLIRLAYVLTGEQQAAEDLLQSALTKAAAHWGRIHSAPEAYVRQIIYREQVSWWRRYYLTSKGMRAGIESAKVVRIPGTTAQGRPDYTVQVTLVPGETGQLNAIIPRLVTPSRSA